jgi:hypothetical protein
MQRPIFKMNITRKNNNLQNKQRYFPLPTSTLHPPITMRLQKKEEKEVMVYGIKLPVWRVEGGMVRLGDLED